MTLSSSPVRPRPHSTRTVSSTIVTSTNPVERADDRSVRMGWQEAVIRYRCPDCAGPGLTEQGHVCNTCQPVEARTRALTMRGTPGARLVDGVFPVRFCVDVATGTVIDRADGAVVWADAREGVRMARMVADGRNARWLPLLRGCPAYARTGY